MQKKLPDSVFELNATRKQKTLDSPNYKKHRPKNQDTTQKEEKKQ